MDIHKNPRDALHRFSPLGPIVKINGCCFWMVLISTVYFAQKN